METENYWDKVDTQSLKDFYYPGWIQERPPLNANHHRVYNNPLCPFAEKGRIALAARGLEFQQANVDLNDKPQFFVEIGGSVPILETPDGQIFNTSDLVIEYANKEGSGIQLVSDDEQTQKDVQAFITKFSNGYLVAYFTYLKTPTDENAETLYGKFKDFEDELAKNTDGNKYFLNNSEITIADIHIAPTVLRIYSFLDGKFFPNSSEDLVSEYPHITSYIEAVTSHPKIGAKFAPKLALQNFTRRKLREADLKLCYPIDLTPYEDTQSQKTLRILNHETAKPLTNEKFVRLYGHPLCPFTERGRLSFKAKEIQHQFVGLDLTDKNKWHKDVNGGTTPFVENTDGKFVIESLGVANWAQDHTEEGINLYPGDETNQTVIKEAIDSLFKMGISIIISVFKHEERIGEGYKTYVEGFEKLNEELEKSSSDYFLNQEHETMADLMTFPFVHRGMLVRGSSLRSKYYDGLDLTKISKLQKWYDNLAHKYSNSIGKEVDFVDHLERNIEAAGPKIPLYYPLVSEAHI